MLKIFSTKKQVTKQTPTLIQQDLELFEELDDADLLAIVGGAKIVDLESQLEKLNPQTEVGKALLKSLEALVKGAE
ncbi:MAG: hypothetical protein RMZ43_033505 [Nostoc sp. CmiVER01]|uniref:hypothetical protein n=1 Tax=Nostoc sp. CmiVER01 TaxID=3075384 RepID=UPI002AD50412|nr:hypothetical protein [Nostoc sp. CmiVER01]MDZ8120712.1 hypothetical protein [Nostoc sp. CmiVER01]